MQLKSNKGTPNAHLKKKEQAESTVKSRKGGRKSTSSPICSQGKPRSQRLRNKIRNRFELDTCKLCGEANPEQIVECEYCEEWVCQVCAEITEDEFDILSKPNSKMHWFCESCTEPALALLKKREGDKMVRDLYQQYLTPFVEEINRKMRKLEDELITVKNEASEMRKKLTSDKETETTKAPNQEAAKIANQEAAKIGIKEIADREARSKNLLLFNVPESKSDDSPTRKEEDEALVKTLCKDVLELDVPFSQTTRLGPKKAGHSRPLRITVESKEQHEAVLRQAKNLKNHQDKYQNLSIRPDLTRLEREEMRELVQEKKQKQAESNQSGDGKIWIIRNWKVINVVRNPYRN